MHDAALVGRVKGLGDLLDDVDRAARIEGRARSDQVRERHALEQLHDQVMHAAVGDVEVEHLHDVRMPQGRGYLRLLPKPGERLAIPGEAGAEHLDRERPRQARVGREVDLAASPLRERAHDPVRVLQDRTDREARGDERRGQVCFRA